MRNLYLRIAGAGLTAALVGPRAASAQGIELSGVWAPLFHEDVDERIPGPNIGDYAGLPINDAAPLRMTVAVHFVQRQFPSRFACECTLVLWR